MKNRFFNFALFVISALVFVSCGVSSSSKISKLNSIEIENGLGEKCSVKCYFCEDLDNWIEYDNVNIFANNITNSAKKECKQRGSFVPKEITIFSVDSIVTDNGKNLYHVNAHVEFIASNAFGVKDLFNESYNIFFFESDNDYMRAEYRRYPNESKSTFAVIDELRYNIFIKCNTIKKESILDSFLLNGKKYYMYDLLYQ